MRRVVLATIAVAGWWLLSCREIPSPEEGVLSISPLILPSPGLVINDTMRDSLGLVAPLRVIAYDVEGNPIPGVVTSFVVRDTGAHVDGALLIGDDTVATRVLGVVAGLQTKEISVPVTLAPQQILAIDSVHHAVSFVAFADTMVNSTDLRVRVVNVGGATPKGIEAIVVRYDVVQAPLADNPSGPTVVLMPGNWTTVRDTTDPSGNAGRFARLRSAPITVPRTDSAVINATASYRGQTLGTVQFTVVFTKQ